MNNQENEIAELKRRLEVLEKRMYFNEKLFTYSTVATVPNWKPKTFIEQFAVYDTGAERGVHIYIKDNWRTEILT
ncbi:MAG TPA: hypothetical protein DHV62_09670 [Elusimicrobia bacterium]|nr:hypothetical protein [Elusimicrobiota bacterium]